MTPGVLMENDVMNFECFVLPVEKEFAALMEEMRESRDLHVLHGGVLSNYVLKGPPKKYKGMLQIRQNTVFFFKLRNVRPKS